MLQTILYNNTSKRKICVWLFGMGREGGYMIKCFTLVNSKVWNLFYEG